MVSVKSPKVRQCILYFRQGYQGQARQLSLISTSICQCIRHEHSKHGNNKSQLKSRFGCILESTLCRLVGEGRGTAARTGIGMQVSLMDHLDHDNSFQSSTQFLGLTCPELHRKRMSKRFYKVAVEFWQR